MSRILLPVLPLLLISSSVVAQENSAPPKGSPSPLSLLRAPKDPGVYYETKVRAGELIEAGKWAEAEPLLERLVRDYALDKDNWWLLGLAKRRLEKHGEAVAAYQTAGSYRPWYSAGWEKAIHLLKAGNRRAALDSLREEVFERRNPYRQSIANEDELEALHSDPEFREIVGRPDTIGWTRDVGWRRDIDYLAAEVKRVNPDYHDEPLPIEFTRRQEELKDKVPTLSNEEIFIGMGRMLAVLHQGHTWLSGFSEGSGLIKERQIPVFFYAFPEGIFIVDATDEHKNLIGSRVLSIEDTLAEEALRLIFGTLSVDGDMEYILEGPKQLRKLPYLKGLGIARSSDAVSLTLQKPGQPSRRTTLPFVAPLPSRKLNPPPGVSAPLFLRDVTQMHWELPLPQHDAMYVQLNNLLPDKDETLPDFGKRLRVRLQQEKPRNLIIDLRHNTGGTTQTYPELLRTIVGFSQLPERRVYVLIGRSTYSAAANLITDLERLADPIFVGEASSECCNLYGDAAPLTLPYSKITGAVTARRWNLSLNVFDTRREISPEVPVQLRAKDYFAGRDPALDRIFALIAANEKDTASARSRGNQ